MSNKIEKDENKRNEIEDNLLFWKSHFASQKKDVGKRSEGHLRLFGSTSRQSLNSSSEPASEGAPWVAQAGMQRPRSAIRPKSAGYNAFGNHSQPLAPEISQENISQPAHSGPPAPKLLKMKDSSSSSKPKMFADSLHGLSTGLIKVSVNLGDSNKEDNKPPRPKSASAVKLSEKTYSTRIEPEQIKQNQSFSKMSARPHSAHVNSQRSSQEKNSSLLLRSSSCVDSLRNEVKLATKIEAETDSSSPHRSSRALSGCADQEKTSYDSATLKEQGESNEGLWWKNKPGFVEDPSKIIESSNRLRNLRRRREDNNRPMQKDVLKGGTDGREIPKARPKKTSLAEKVTAIRHQDLEAGPETNHGINNVLTGDKIKYAADPAFAFLNSKWVDENGKAKFYFPGEQDPLYSSFAPDKIFHPKDLNPPPKLPTKTQLAKKKAIEALMRRTIPKIQVCNQQEDVLLDTRVTKKAEEQKITASQRISSTSSDTQKPHRRGDSLAPIQGHPRSRNKTQQLRMQVEMHMTNPNTAEASIPKIQLHESNAFTTLYKSKGLLVRTGGFA